MIKKIDANEYGVVKYAITSVDELNRLPKKIAPSSQAILIENGLRVFVYGDGQWVEEVVDGDLSENMQSIVADYERSKIGYDGVKRGSLEERLKDDFQGIYDILNARDYCEYSSKELKVDNTWMGNQIDTRVEGRTLQNLWDIKNIEVDDYVSVDEKYVTVKANLDDDYVCSSIAIDKILLKPKTKYTIITEVAENTFTSSNPDANFNANVAHASASILDYAYRFRAGEIGIKVDLVTTRDEFTNDIYYGVRTFLNYAESGYVKYRCIILEGDYTSVPLSELPYFEGIESVGEREIGKNLFDGVLEVGSYDVNGTPAGGVHAVRSKNYIEIDPNKQYCISLKDYSSYFYIHCYDKDKKNIGEVSMKSNFKPLEGCKYITFNTYNGVTSDLNSPIQLEEGTQATPYEPFGYKISGKSCGKNLFDIKRVLPTQNGEVEIIKDGFKLTRISDGIGDTFGASYEIKLKPNTKYILKANTEISKQDVKLIMYSYEDRLWGDVSLGVGEFGKSQTSIMTKNGNCIIGFYFLTSIASWEKGDYAIIKNIQLEESTSSTPYEPYQESTYSIHSPIPLRSLPSGVCDVYDFESGAVIQRVGKVVLDGTEEFNLENTTSEIPYFNYTSTEVKKLSNNAETGALYCDRFIPTTVKHTYNGLIEGVSQGGNGNYIQIAINKNKLSTIDNKGLSDWLQANPTTVYYELEEPIIHYLTPSQLKSFDGTTHVISENTLIPTTTTKILTDTYTNVSNVNSTAYSLRRGVNDVAETSDIINETDVEQDDVLDVTMCAIDELYSMLEPNLE